MRIAYEVEIKGSGTNCGEKVYEAKDSFHFFDNCGLK
jgi:hypothetical protein